MGYLGMGMLECGIPGGVGFWGSRCREWIWDPQSWLGFIWWLLWGYHPRGVSHHSPLLLIHQCRHLPVLMRTPGPWPPPGPPAAHGPHGNSSASRPPPTRAHPPLCWGGTPRCPQALGLLVALRMAFCVSPAPKSTPALCC